MVRLSVVVPLFNEEENVTTLCEQIAKSLDGFVDYEVVMVDDGSSDGTRVRFEAIAGRFPTYRLLAHPHNLGQSAALCTGVLAAHGELIAILDGDLQNDPADIPTLLRRLDQAGAGRWLIAGNRSDRQDSRVRRASSRIANLVRGSLLRDGCPDTGCSLKLFRREDFLLLPQFDHMHRFLPSLFLRESVRIINVPVNHRPRVAGESKYGMGNRLWVGIVDLLGVWWLQMRGFRLSAAERLDPSGHNRRSFR